MITALTLIALASPVDVLGFTSQGASLAGSTVARPEGAAVASYNPALAADLDDVTATVGYSAAAMELTLNGGPHELDPARAVHLGLVIPLSLGDFGRAGFSAAFVLPDEHLMRARILRDGRPRLLMYDNQVQRLDVDLAASWAMRLGDWRFGVAGGAGMMAGASGDGLTFLMTENGEYRSADARISARLPLLLLPMAAAFVRWRDYSFGLSVRAGGQFDLNLGVAADIGFGALRGNVFTAVAASDFFTPPRVCAGLAWNSTLVAVHAAVSYYQWSSVRTGTRILGNIEFSGLDVHLPIDPTEHNEEFSDVVVPRVGVELSLPTLAERLQISLRAGGYYEPSPVVDSDVMLDSDRVAGAVGAGISTVGPLWVFPRPLSLDVHLLMIGVLPRTFPASGPEAPRPDLTLEGYLISGGASLTVRL